MKSNNSILLLRGSRWGLDENNSLECFNKNIYIYKNIYILSNGNPSIKNMW